MYRRRAFLFSQFGILFALMWFAALVCQGRDNDAVNAGQSPITTSTVLIEKKVNVINPSIKQTVFVVPTPGGKAVIQETISGHAKWLESSHGKAFCATYTRPTGGNSISLKISGSQANTVYMDIDGDGFLDLMEDRTDFRSYILIENKWTEVRMGSPSLPKVGVAAITVDKAEVTYVFKDSKWVNK